MGKLILNHIFLHEEQYVILTWNFMQLIHKLLLQLGEGILLPFPGTGWLCGVVWQDRRHSGDRRGCQRLVMTLAHHCRFSWDCEGREAKQAQIRMACLTWVRAILEMKTGEGTPAQWVNSTSLAYYFMLAHEIFIEPQRRFFPRREGHT